jgi:hypothetical protein
MRFECKVILAIRDSRSYGKISAWAPNGTELLTRAPMFGKSLPFTNDMSSSRHKVFYR